MDRPAKRSRRVGAPSGSGTPRGVGAAPHKWEFKPRFRRHAFGWKSQPAIQRVREAVAEIKKAARKDAALGAEGAVIFLEHVSPAIEQVDSSSGAIGNAVFRAIEELVPIIAGAEVARSAREAWLERLWEAHAADQIPYIEALADFWGELCGTEEIASAWADRLVGIVRASWSPDPELRGHFHGTTACLSALQRARRHRELVELLKLDRVRFWPYQRFGIGAVAAIGGADEAIRFADSLHGPHADDRAISLACEEILLGAGRSNEAYERYAIDANRGTTNLSTYRALAKKYPSRPPRELLTDLIASAPGDEGKWFATAKEIGLYDEALALVTRAPCDPKTLTRAARDFADERPTFAVEVGIAALRWLTEGFGYEITSADVWAAYSATVKAAEKAGTVDDTQSRIRELVRHERAGGFVTHVLGRQLGIS